MFDVGSILSPITNTIGGFIGIDASRKAGHQGEDAAARATAGMDPFRAAGVNALGTLQERIGQGPGEYEESPYYNFHPGCGSGRARA